MPFFGHSAYILANWLAVKLAGALGGAPAPPDPPWDAGGSAHRPPTGKFGGGGRRQKTSVRLPFGFHGTIIMEDYHLRNAISMAEIKFLLNFFHPPTKFFCLWGSGPLVRQSQLPILFSARGGLSPPLGQNSWQISIESRNLFV